MVDPPTSEHGDLMIRLRIVCDLKDVEFGIGAYVDDGETRAAWELRAVAFDGGAEVLHVEAL